MAELDQRFQLGEVGEDRNKITWCQLLIGTTGSSILSGLDGNASWETSTEILLSRLGIVSVKDEAWAVLKNLKKGSKEIVELAGEAEKLSKRLHPRDEEAAERHAIDAFLGALERPLAAEVQKLGCRTLEDVVAAARQIEKVLEEQTDSKMERLISSMQDQIRLLKKDLKEAHDQISTHQAAAAPTTALAATPVVTVAAAHPPPLTQPPPLATAQPPPPSPAHHLYQDYPEEGSYFRPPRRQPDRRPPRCFLCGEEALPGSLNPPTLAAPTSARYRSRPSQRTGLGTASHRRWRPKLPSCTFKLLGGSPDAKVTPVGCAVGPPITGQLTLEGIPVLGLVDTGASVTCMGFSVW